MLVARRDPPFHAGESDESLVNHDALAGLRPRRIAHVVTVMQLLGSLLAVPIGLASAYSIYRANFSPETACQTLRAGIISMLDKSVDAGTRRMLVRGDVVKFEQNCAAVDPDAVAAFKTLLTEEKRPVAAAPVTQHEQAPVKEAVHKDEPHPQETAKQAPIMNSPIASEWVHHEPAVSDTQWLDAVRQAMARHKQEQASVDANRPLTLGAPPHPLQAPAAQPQAAAVAPAPVLAVAPVAPAPVVAATPPDADHPVPPGAIPDPSDVAAAKPDKPRSRIGRLIEHMPLLGTVWENGRQ
jgi:hypothetical protein